MLPIKKNKADKTYIQNQDQADFEKIHFLAFKQFLANYNKLKKIKYQFSDNSDNYYYYTGVRSQEWLEKAAKEVEVFDDT